MKLLSRISAYYIFFSILLFLAGGIIFTILLNNIFYRQIDENLLMEKLLIQETINHADTLPDFHSVFGHTIDVSLIRKVIKKAEYYSDTIAYDRDAQGFIPARHLAVRDNDERGRGYSIHIYKSLKETRKLIAEILIVTTIIFVLLLAMLVIVNYYVARRAWIPFYHTLSSLSHYDINRDIPLVLKPSRIHEFIRLNEALERMSKKIRRDFLNLKEFNENASHELQTPLAVIKSKLDLLVQNENLTEEQLKQIGTVYDSVARMSKLNQGLLLISKIDNNQFIQEEEVGIGLLTDRILEHLKEFIEHKEIVVTREYLKPWNVRMNPVLAEILITNLLSNAIKHNVRVGTITIRIGEDSLEISNTGMPLTVTPEDLFERFRKGGRRDDSAGLGLAIVKKIVDYYGMRVEYRHDGILHVLKIC
jgi:signal transduction histidine kinase